RELDLLRHVSAQRGRLLGTWSVAEQAYPPGVELEPPDQEVEQGRFAGSVRADQRQGASLQLYAYFVQPVPVPEAAHANGGNLRGYAPPSHARCGNLRGYAPLAHARSACVRPN